MSRIGNKAITIPAGVEIDLESGNEVTVKGPKGTLSRKIHDQLEVKIDAGILTVARPNDEKFTKQIHGTSRSLIYNMIIGVNEGFKKELEIVGIGYRAAVANNVLTLNIGYSNPVKFEIEEGIKIECPSMTQIVVSGIDKQRVGEWASNIRAVRKPEPYNGKGIRYKDEFVRRKEGKTAGKK